MYNQMPLSLYPPAPHQIRDIQQRNIGGAHRKFLVTDDANKVWLFKPHQDKSIIETEMAAAAICRKIGVASPVVYGRSLYYKEVSMLGSLQPWIGEGVVPWEISRSFVEFTNNQIKQLQCHQIVDWLIGNPDVHRGQFIVLEQGPIVAVDKTQALMIFPHDRLSWDARSVWTNNRRSIYYYLFRLASARKIHVDPEIGLEFADYTQNHLDDEELRSVWAPVVDAWGLDRLRIAVSRFRSAKSAKMKLLDLLIQRKRNLLDEFANLYYHESRGVW